MRKLDPALLERVRNSLREDPKAKERHRDWMKVTGGDPDSPYEPDDHLVRTHACRIAAEEEREQFSSELEAERPDITRLYDEYQHAKSDDERGRLAEQVGPLLTARIKDLTKRAHVSSFGCHCGSRGDKVEDLRNDMVALEAVYVHQRQLGCI